MGTAVFAALTAIPGQIGISGVDSNFGTFGDRRFLVVLLQSLTGWIGQCGCVDRQTQRFGNGCIFLLRIPRTPDQKTAAGLTAIVIGMLVMLVP